MPSAKKLRGRQKKAKKRILLQDFNPAFADQTPERPLPEDVTRDYATISAALSRSSPEDTNGAQLAAAGATTRPGTGPTKAKGPTKALTPYAVRDMYFAKKKVEPAMQVMQVLRLELECDGRGNEIWVLELSDGNTYFPGTIHPSIAHLVEDSTIEQYCTVRILGFIVEESHDSGGRYCVVYEAEAVGPNPGRAIGKPFWLTDDVLKRITKMDRRATSHVLTVFTQFDGNAEEADSLMRHGLPKLLFAAIKKGFMDDCMTIKEKHRMEILFDWFEILSAIVKTDVLNAAKFCKPLRPVLELFLAPVENESKIEYYGTTNNYFMSLARLFKIVSGIAEMGIAEKAFWRDDAFFEFACGAVFWHLDENNKSEYHDVLCGVCDAGSSFIRHELISRAVQYEGRSLEFTAQLLSIANMRVCPDDSTFSSSMFGLVKGAPTRVEVYLDILKIFMHHDCVDRDMIRNIVELAGFLHENGFLGCSDCLYILYDSFRASGDHHGSRDRRMSIAVEAGLIELILKMNDEEAVAPKCIVHSLDQGATRGSKLCLSMARVDVEELMRSPDVDVDGPFWHRIEKLVVSARELCTRTCTCCAASLAVGRIFRCDECGTVYCSRICQTKDWTMGGHKKTCSGYDRGRGVREGVLTK